jgi:PKD repeat protein
VGDAPLTVDFSDLSVVTGDDFIVSWIWNFGDDSDSFDQNPTHVYTMAGSYTVTLTVTTNGGLSSMYTINNFITVNPPQFEGQPAEGEVVEGEVPAEGQPVEGEATEGEATEGGLPEEGQPVEGQVAEGQPAEGQVAEGQAVEGQIEEGQAAEGQDVEGQDAEGQAKEGQTPEGAKPEGAKPEGQDTDKEGQATANDGEPAGTNNTVTFGCAG